MKTGKGSLIVIEGTDGSGKHTQTKLLLDDLSNKYKYRGNYQDVVMTSFPEYGDPSSTLVKEYLAGKYGADPESVNPYAASTFYAVDRYASYKSKPWGRAYDAGGIVLADRYTTSNAVHQAEKIAHCGSSMLSVVSFLNWLFDFEYCKMGIPEPDMVIYLDMDTDVAAKTMQHRAETDKEHVTDIHEKDIKYLKRCRENGLYVAKTCGWTIIPCSENGMPLTIDAIHQEVIKAVSSVLEL